VELIRVLISMQYSPKQVAEHAAKAFRAADPSSTSAPISITDRVGASQIAAAPSKQPKHVNRDNRAAGMAPPMNDTEPSSKRKAGELEDGQVPLVEDLESGEVVDVEQGGDALEGDEYVEVIEGGRAVKMRKVDL
jgi:hypothetical protein